MKLSAIVPAYKDPFVVPTIKSLLDNSEIGNMEVIVVLDGFWPNFELPEDKRIRYVHLGKNRGMRDAINTGVELAKGEYILRSDQHCMFGKGYDRIMIEDCKPNWIMTAPQYFLDPVKWERMEPPPVLCQKLVVQGGSKFSGQRWRERDEKYKNKDLVETMAMQGSMWLMPRKWFMDVIYPLQTAGYGQMYQDSHEMVFKTWKKGGRLILDKRTWFAHKHRSFKQGRHEGTKENPSLRSSSGKYCLKIWGDYYQKEIRPKWKI